MLVEPTVVQLLEKAESKKLEIISITDHDKIDAYLELDDGKRLDKKDISEGESLEEIQSKIRDITPEEYIKDILPGFLVSIVVALIGIFIAKFVPKLGAGTISIFLGMFVGNLFLNQDVFQRGYKFSETDILSYSIVLLGATLSVNTLLELGIGGFVFIILQMSITIVGAIYIGKKLGFSQNFRFLMASGNAVCGSSAIAATAPVIDADDKEKGIAITIVNITGIVLMFILPIIARVLFKSDTMQTGALIGGTLQSVGQVAASGAMVGEAVKDMAMIFKILRVVLLVVVVFIFGHLKHKTNEEIVNIFMFDHLILFFNTGYKNCPKNVATANTTVKIN